MDKFLFSIFFHPNSCHYNPTFLTAALLLLHACPFCVYFIKLWQTFRMTTFTLTFKICGTYVLWKFCSFRSLAFTLKNLEKWLQWNKSIWNLLSIAKDILSTFLEVISWWNLFEIRYSSQNTRKALVNSLKYPLTLQEIRIFTIFLNFQI